MVTKQNYIYLYFLIQIFNGAIYYIYGPLLPFLAQESGQSQGNYFFIFTVRGIGYILGAIFQILLGSRFRNLHLGLFISVCGGAIGAYFFTCTLYKPYLALISLESAIFFALLDIFNNITIIHVSGKNVVKNVSRSYGFQAFGGMLGPFLLGLIGKTSLKIVNILLLCCAPFLLFNLSLRSEQKKEEGKVKGKKYLPKKLQFEFCGLILIHCINELIFKVWFPTFCLMMGYASKEKGAFMVSVMVGIIIFIRLFVKIQLFTMLKIGVNGSLLLFLSVIIAYCLDFVLYILYGSAILFGFIFSLQFAYYLGLITESGYTTTLQNYSKFSISLAVGQSVFISIGGLLMQHIHPMALFFYGFGWAIINKVLFSSVLKDLQQSKLQKPLINDVQMNEL